PTDNFSNLSAGTLANDPGFNGNFLIFTTGFVAGITLDQTCAPCSISNEFSVASLLPPGTFVTGLFVTGGQNVGTSRSAHLGATVPGPIVGAGLPGIVAACAGLVGLVRARRKRMAA